ncbi:MAG TPA: aminoacyl-tRNA hydrolase [Pirellulales bacterium]|jgi:PTH1 family peptidyl-tRNA hydrolase|nr:aminoacyl-tRNA hydrolase [Pirellulales bacterium]
MKLVVGLGNPGRKYDGTRHNIGFAVVREVARRHCVGQPKTNFQAEVMEAAWSAKNAAAKSAERKRAGDAGSVASAGGAEKEKVLLLLPQTFMNLSGNSVGAARDFYKLADEDLLIVCDDFNIPLAKLRFRAGGSAGGQKGLADVIRRLGTDQVPRLRVGVGPVPANWDPVDFVLGKFSADESAEIAIAIQRAADAVVDWATEGLASCMNQYN